MTLNIHCLLWARAILEKVVYVFHLNTMKMSTVNLSVGIGFISNPWGYDAWCIHDITYIIAWTSCYSPGSRGLHTLSTCTPEYSLTHNTAVWPSSVYSVHLKDSDYFDIFGMKLELLTSAQSLPQYSTNSTNCTYPATVMLWPQELLVRKMVLKTLKRLRLIIVMFVIICTHTLV